MTKDTNVTVTSMRKIHKKWFRPSSLQDEKSAKQMTKVFIRLKFVKNFKIYVVFIIY